MTASFCAAVASNPFDVAKTRMMNQRANSLYNYKSTVDCLLKVTMATSSLYTYHDGLSYLSVCRHCDMKVL